MAGSQPVDAHRRVLDAYLQGAHLALFAIEGKLKERGALTGAEVEECLAELHAMFASARHNLEDDRTEDPRPLVTLESLRPSKLRLN